MDIATIIGAVTGFGLVLIAIFMGGGFMWFVNVPSLMIVVGGTIGVTLMNYPLSAMLSVIGELLKTVFFISQDHLQKL